MEGNSYTNSNQILANAKSKLAQNFIIGQQLNRIEILYASGIHDLIPEAVNGLVLFTSNLHDPTFTQRQKQIKNQIIVHAQKMYPLRPAEIKMQGIKFAQKQKYIQQNYANKMFEELILMFQRRNVVPAKSIRESEADLSFDEVLEIEQ